jgi:hypothetical protein
MRISLAILFCLARSVLASIEERACAKDNCLRAVGGTTRGSSAVAAARSDCSSFLLSTITLPGHTTTFVSTTISTVTISGNGITQRSNPPVSGAESTKTVPIYASSCSGASRYSSACSCLGITGSIITVTPVVCTLISLFLISSDNDMN